MAFYDTYNTSKDNAQKNALARDAQTMQALQAFANFMQQNKANQVDAQYKQQQMAVDVPYKQALTNSANALTQQRLNPQLNALQQSQMNFNNTRTSVLNNMQNDKSNDPDFVKQQAAKASGYDPNDFVVKPMVRNVAGIPQTIYTPELKKELPGPATKEFSSMAKTAKALNDNLKMLSKNKDSFEKEMNYFNPKAKRGGTFWGNVGSMMMKLDPNSKEFATFRAETDKAFQTYRKETTGAQAALAELGWLAPDFPEADDNPELYKHKAIEAIKRINEGQYMYLDQLSNSGFRTSSLEKMLGERNAESSTESGGSGSSSNDSDMYEYKMINGVQHRRLKTNGKQ
jgi:flavin-binding protein dodecin